MSKIYSYTYAKFSYYQETVAMSGWGPLCRHHGANSPHKVNRRQLNQQRRKQIYTKTKVEQIDIVQTFLELQTINSNIINFCSRKNIEF